MALALAISYACEDCKYYEDSPIDGSWCNLWDIDIQCPDNSSCVSLTVAQTDEVNTAFESKWFNTDK